MTHLRAFWWMYAATCAVQATFIWGFVLLALMTPPGPPPPLIDSVFGPDGFGWALIALELPQCVGLVVLLRRPPAERSEGSSRLAGSVAFGFVLFAALYNWYTLGALTVLTIGAFPIAWTTFVPFVVLRMTYREVVLGDEAG